jgi:hypothetical protein
MKELSMVTDLLIQCLHENAQIVSVIKLKIIGNTVMATLWLVQSKLPDKEKVPLLGVPISPGQTFDPAAAHLLQVSEEDKEANMVLHRLIPKPRMHKPLLPSQGPNWDAEKPASDLCCTCSGVEEQTLSALPTRW